MCCLQSSHLAACSLHSQGVFQEVVPEKGTANLWIMAGGQVLSCDEAFTDWLGYKQEDLHGKPAADLVLEKDQLEE
jgi:PAS domain-containing protein